MPLVGLWRDIVTPPGSKPLTIKVPSLRFVVPVNVFVGAARITVPGAELRHRIAALVPPDTFWIAPLKVIVVLGFAVAMSDLAPPAFNMPPESAI